MVKSDPRGSMLQSLWRKSPSLQDKLKIAFQIFSSSENETSVIYTLLEWSCDAITSLHWKRQSTELVLPTNSK